jgi:hypothetical protein
MFVEDEGELVTMMHKSEADVRVRAGAAMMYLLDPRGKPEWHLMASELLAACYVPGINRRYLGAAAECLSEHIISGRMFAIGAMDQLFRKADCDLDGRALMSATMNRIRQHSKAPVTRVGISAF